MIDDGAKRSFEEQGYVVARGLFDAEETAFLRDHFTGFARPAPIPAMSSGSSRTPTIR